MDARNVRIIVLMRPVNSMIEFKQIVGRGTRLFDGKDYFTIIDFVKAYRHFNDPEWDGEPIDETTQDETDDPPADDAAEVAPEPDEGDAPRPRPGRVKVRLADGKERHIQHMVTTTFRHPDGRPMSAQQFMDSLFGAVPAFARDEAELRAKWGEPETRAGLLQGLAERGFKGEQLAEMQRLLDAEDSDLFDVLAYVAYSLPTHTRQERAADARSALGPRLGGTHKEFVDFVLSEYVKVGVQQLDKDNLSALLKLKYGTLSDALPHLGSLPEIKRLFTGFQQHLYAK